MKRSRILDEVRETAKGSYRSGAISRRKLREFEVLTRQGAPSRAKQVCTLERRARRRDGGDAVFLDVNSNNVFADLDLPDAWTLGAKCRLAAWTRAQVMRKRWSLRTAMKRLGASAKGLSDLLGQNFEKVTLDQAVRYLRCLGQRVELVLFNDAQATRRPRRTVATSRRGRQAPKRVRGGTKA